MTEYGGEEPISAATKAWAEGKFDDELVAVSVPQKRGDPIVFDRDEGVRDDATPESLAKLRPIEKDGVVTAGNASQQNDAAAACLVVAEDKLAELNLEPMGWFVSWAAAGCDPSRMGIGPVPAVKRLFDRTGMGWDDIDLVELNEAFAPQVLAVLGRGCRAGMSRTRLAERQRLARHQPRPSDRRHRRHVHPRQPAARAEAAGRQIWPGDHVHRWRAGDRGGVRGRLTSLNRAGTAETEAGGARATLALFVAGFATFSLIYSAQPLLPQLASEFGLGAAAASWALSATTAALAVSIVVAGALSETLGRKGLMFASMCAAAALNLACAAAPTWAMLLTARALEGLALSGRRAKRRHGLYRRGGRRTWSGWVRPWASTSAAQRSAA